MALLEGFPPSNTIITGIRMPTIEKIQIHVGKLKKEQRFEIRNNKFFTLGSSEIWPDGVRAICYKSTDFDHTLGAIYCFKKDVKVTWLKEVY